MPRCLSLLATPRALRPGASAMRLGLAQRPGASAMRLDATRLAPSALAARSALARPWLLSLGPVPRTKAGDILSHFRHILSRLDLSSAVSDISSAVSQSILSHLRRHLVPRPGISTAVLRCILSHFSKHPQPFQTVPSTKAGDIHSHFSKHPQPFEDMAAALRAAARRKAG